MYIYIYICICICIYLISIPGSLTNIWGGHSPSCSSRTPGATSAGVPWNPWMVFSQRIIFPEEFVPWVLIWHQVVGPSVSISVSHWLLSLSHIVASHISYSCIWQFWQFRKSMNPRKTSSCWGGIAPRCVCCWFPRACSDWDEKDSWTPAQSFWGP